MATLNFGGVQEEVVTREDFLFRESESNFTR